MRAWGARRPLAVRYVVCRLAELVERTSVLVPASNEGPAIAGLIQPTNDSPARYRINGKAWKSLLELDQLAPWSHWSAVYALVAEFDRWKLETRDRTVSAYAFGVTTLELAEKYRSVFRRAGVGPGRSATGGKRVVREPIEDWNTSVVALSAWIRANA